MGRLVAIAGVVAALFVGLSAIADAKGKDAKGGSGHKQRDAGTDSGDSAQPCADATTVPSDDDSLERAADAMLCLVNRER